jgi:hypothetical protein
MEGWMFTMAKRSLNKFAGKKIVFRILTLFFFTLIINYFVAFNDLFFALRITDISTYRVGYIALFTGISSLVILLGDVFLFTLAFRWFVLNSHVDRSKIGVFATSFTSAVIPIFLLLAPNIIIGVGGVLAEDLFYQCVAFIVFVWNAIVASYALFIHPIYSPFASLFISICIESREPCFKCVYRIMNRNLRLIKSILASTIVLWILSNLLAPLMVSIVPYLGNTILTLPEAMQYAVWGKKVFSTFNRLMPRYYNLILQPIQYLIYVYIFKKVSKNQLLKLATSL